MTLVLSIRPCSRSMHMFDACSFFMLTGSALRAPGSTTTTAERTLHRSTGRAARLSWPTRGRRRFAGLMFMFP